MVVLRCKNATRNILAPSLGLLAPNLNNGRSVKAAGAFVNSFRTKERIPFVLLLFEK